MEQGYHTPVLLEESVGLLSVDPEIGRAHV